MSRKFFDVGKVGCYLETIAHSTERRKDGEVKVLQLTLRVDPFDTKLAAAVAPEVRTSLFKLNNAQPHEHLRKVYFALGTTRQRMTIFATPDARTSKDARGYVLVFKAIFGPPGAHELEYCELWRNTMAFVTFSEAEHDEALDLDGAGEAEDADAEQQPHLPEPEFETTASGEPLDDPPAARGRLHSHRQSKPGRAADAKKGVH